MTATLMLYPQYVGEFGDLAAAAVMSALRREYEPNLRGRSRLRVWRARHWWVAKAHHELTELTGLTSRQLQTAVAKLVRSGRVLVKIMTFNGAPTRHFRVPEFVDLCPRETVEQPVTVRPKPKAVQAPTSVDVKCITESSVDTVEAKALAAGAAKATPAGHAEQQPGKIEAADVGAVQSIAKTVKRWLLTKFPPIGEPTNMAKLQEIMALKNAQAVHAPGKNTPRALSLLWRKRLGAEYGGFQKELTGKDMGMLKHFSRGAGDRAEELLDYVLQHWQAFVWRARAEKGLHTAPERPVIGFVLAHWDCAVRLVDEQQVQPAAAAPTKIEKPLSKAGTMPAKIKHDVASPDEVQAMINEFKGL